MHKLSNMIYQNIQTDEPIFNDHHSTIQQISKHFPSHTKPIVDFHNITNPTDHKHIINRQLYNIHQYLIQILSVLRPRYGTGCWSGMDQVGAPTWGSAPLHPSYKRVASSASSPIPILSIVCALQGPDVVRGKFGQRLKAS